MQCDKFRILQSVTYYDIICGRDERHGLVVLCVRRDFYLLLLVRRPHFVCLCGKKILSRSHGSEKGNQRIESLASLPSFAIVHVIHDSHHHYSILSMHYLNRDTLSFQPSTSEGDSTTSSSFSSSKNASTVVSVSISSASSSSSSSSSSSIGLVTTSATSVLIKTRI